jgi:ketosteroid isomerase-like protein
MEHSEGEALVRALLQAIGTRDREALTELLDEDVRWSWPASVSIRWGWPRPVVGRAETLKRLAPEVSAFQDGSTTWEVLQVLVDGDRVAFAAERRATRADGRPYNVEYVFLLRFGNGRIVEALDTLDTALALPG